MEDGGGTVVARLVFHPVLCMRLSETDTLPKLILKTSEKYGLLRMDLFYVSTYHRCPFNIFYY